jgi:hypothetical protein
MELVIVSQVDDESLLNLKHQCVSKKEKGFFFPHATAEMKPTKTHS